MRLKRLGSLHQSRLSFMRILTRRMAREGWEFSRPVFEIDSDGVGHAVYSAKAQNHTYSLIAFAHNLPNHLRSDRVIAETWDATFALFDGIPTDDDINRLRKTVPKQEAGRISEKELSLSRANRSVRLWNHVVDALSQGRQPDPNLVQDVGYLMRTTAVYGSGKFGAADREEIADRPEMQTPFQAEMLSVYLTRTFVRDLVQHMARIIGGSDAVDLDPALAQQLGIGNSTGLGMAPFIINHPLLFNNWITTREEAISRIRLVQTATVEEISCFQDLLHRSYYSTSQRHSNHPLQIEKLSDLRRDVSTLVRHCGSQDLVNDYPWDRLLDWGETHMTEEGQELLASLILEPYPDLVDDLAVSMSDGNKDAFRINGAMAVSEVSRLIELCAGWALEKDWSAPKRNARIWYVSEEKLEPRLGERFEESLNDYEQPLAPARDLVATHTALAGWDPGTPIASFLLQHPEHRHSVRRAQISAIAPYSEVRDNTISADTLPIDMLRAKLSFFGATNFDPRSDRWVRICMYSGAPYPENLDLSNGDLWVYPEAPQ